MRDQIDRLIESILSGASAGELAHGFKSLELDATGTHGRTPLMVAAAEGIFLAVEALVKGGASIHAKGRGGMTALHEASANGQARVVAHLLSLGANVDAETIDGITPLMCAAAWGNTEVARLLLDCGADRLRIDRTGASAIDIADEKGEIETAMVIGSYPSPSR